MRKKIAVIICIFLLALTGCNKEEKICEEEVAPQKEDINIISNEPMEVEESQPKEIHIVMAGDMLLHDRIESVSENEDGSFQFQAIFENTKDIIQSADIAIANQEVIIGGTELGISGYPAFNCPYEFGDALVEAGFDVVCQGTNHALDKGEKGILNCKSFWKDNYPQIGVLGVHDSVEDDQAVYIYEDESGIRIAILNYTYGTNGIKTPDGKEYLVEYLNETDVERDLKYAEENADFTIVCPHWGTEYSLDKSTEQTKWANIFVKNGADLIIGTHPHVIEPIEWIEDEESANKALVYYSIGNFVNWTSGEGPGVSNRMVGGLASIKLRINENKVEIAEYGIIPIVSHVTSEKNGVTVYKLSDYNEDLAAVNEINKQVDDFSYEYCENLVDVVWSENSLLE